MANIGLWRGGYDPVSLGFQGQSGARPGQGLLSFNPTPYTDSFLPTFTPGDPGSMAAAQMGGAMSGGWQRRGIQAFLPGDLNFADMDWSPVTSQYGESGGPMDARVRGGFSEGDVARNSSLGEYNDYLNSFRDQVVSLAGQLGYDTSGYNLDNIDRLGMGPAWQERWVKESPSSREAGRGNFQDLVRDMNKDLSNFVRLRGASAGYDGRGNARSTSEALYYIKPDGTYVPVSPPRRGSKPEHRGWAREDGAEFIRGVSMLLPAVGGWAGLLGQGTAGTVTGLTGGLGLTTGVPSAIVNAGMSALLGGGTNGLLSGLGGYLGGLGAGALGLPPGLGSQVGRLATNYLLSQGGSGGSSGNGLQGLISGALGGAGTGTVGGLGGGANGVSGKPLTGSAPVGGGRVGSGSAESLAGLLSLLGNAPKGMGFIDPNPKDDETKDTVNDVLSALRDSKGKVVV